MSKKPKAVKSTKKSLKTLKEVSRQRLVDSHKKVLAKKKDGETSAFTAPTPTPPQAPPVAAREIGMPKREIRLRDPEFIRHEGKVVRIIGKCNWKDTEDGPFCTTTREIAPQDAFQVWLCIPHQRKLNHRKIAQRRKAQRAAAAARAKAEEASKAGEVPGPEVIAATNATRTAASGN